MQICKAEYATGSAAALHTGKARPAEEIPVSERKTRQAVEKGMTPASLVSRKMRKAVPPHSMDRPGTFQYTEVPWCQKTTGKTEIQGCNSLPLVLLSQQGTIKLQGTASR